MSVQIGLWLLVGLAVLGGIFSPGAAQAAVCAFSGPHGSGTYTCVNTGNPVANGQNLSDTIHPASGIACGDTVVLPRGATFAAAGNGPGGMNSFTGWLGCTSRPITIKSDGLANLPAGVRVSYASTPQMATLTGTSADPTWNYWMGAGGYTFQGLVFTTADLHPSRHAPTIVFHNVADGGGTDQIHDIVYDRVIIRPFEESQPAPDSIPWRSASIGLRLDGIRMIGFAPRVPTEN